MREEIMVRFMKWSELASRLRVLRITQPTANYTIAWFVGDSDMGFYHKVTMRTEWIRRMCKIPRAGPGKSSTIVTMNPTQPLLYHHNIHNHRKRICQWPSSKRMIRSNCKEIFTYLFKDYPFRLNWLLSTHPGFFLPKAVNKSTFWREESQDLRLSFKGESLSKKDWTCIKHSVHLCTITCFIPTVGFGVESGLSSGHHAV